MSAIDSGVELPAGEQGLVYFEGGWDFQYLGDPERHATAGTRSIPVGPRLVISAMWIQMAICSSPIAKSHMIISGGVNIYPQEVENLLITHPKVADAAVIGVPNPDFGEEVKAVVQLLDQTEATQSTKEQLIDFCRSQLSPVKCPRSIDFDPALPRLDNGKLYKRLIKERYWPQSVTKL
jgi:hypothetical protein